MLGVTSASGAVSGCASCAWNGASRRPAETRGYSPSGASEKDALPHSDHRRVRTCDRKMWCHFISRGVGQIRSWGFETSISGELT
jgi:hypothetical protein